MSAEELYQEVIMDHASRPRNFGELSDPTVRIEAENPMCGDEITLYLQTSKEDENHIAMAHFTGQACAICTASASMLTIKVRGLDCQRALELSRTFQQFLSLGPDEPSAPAIPIGDLKVLEGVRKFPMRVKCATLAWHALDQAIAEIARGGTQSKLIEGEIGPEIPSG